MQTLTTSLALLADQWQMAAVEGGVFFIGIFSASIVIRHRLRFLMAFPQWLMGNLAKLLESKPGYLFILLFIFCFNSAAIFIYMMTGALLQLLPTAVCFLTGMNIGIVAGTAQVFAAVSRAARRRISEERGPDDFGVDELLPPERETEAPVFPPRGMTSAQFYTQTVCVILVALLELPAFWFAIALGTSLSRHWLPLAGPGVAESILARMTAYVTVIVPVLAISAAVEAVAVRMSTKETGPQGGEEA